MEQWNVYNLYNKLAYIIFTLPKEEEQLLSPLTLPHYFLPPYWLGRLSAPSLVHLSCFLSAGNSPSVSHLLLYLANFTVLPTLLFFFHGRFYPIHIIPISCIYFFRQVHSSVSHLLPYLSTFMLLPTLYFPLSWTFLSHTHHYYYSCIGLFILFS